jgi:hypothetical protein
MVITITNIFNLGNAISGAPLLKEQTSYQNHQLTRHNKKENHNNACAVTTYYIADNYIHYQVTTTANSIRILQII